MNKSKRPEKGPSKSDLLSPVEIVKSYINAYPSKIGKQLYKAIRADNHLPVVDLSISPTDYSCPDLFKRDWQTVNLLAKYRSLSLPYDVEQVAMDNFWTAEQNCSKINTRFNCGTETSSTEISGASFIWMARQKISQLLGDFSWDEASNGFGFSSGASATKTRERGDPYYKYQDKPEVTRKAGIAGLCAIFSTPRWRENLQDLYGPDPYNWVSIVPGSTLALVDKDAKSKRVITKEPSLNMHMQLGLGRMVRARLRNIGIDLNDQTNNANYAHIGSRDGTYSTIDLKQASDHICYELVRELLPPDWFAAFDLLRCEACVLPSKEIHTLSKFSSMGNGYTFELESLIFWALASAVNSMYTGVERRVLVYGDDVIVPTAIAGQVIELFEYVGFYANNSKTFITGPFRESCGSHYFNGIDVTPFYVRRPIDHLSRYFWLVNSIRYHSDCGGVCDPRGGRWYADILRKIPLKYRYRVPPGYGFTSGIISSLDEARPIFSRRGQTWLFRYLHEGPGRTVEPGGTEMVLRALQTRPESSYSDGLGGSASRTTIVVRRSQTVFRVKKAACSWWADAPLLRV